MEISSLIPATFIPRTDDRMKAFGYRVKIVNGPTDNGHVMGIPDIFAVAIGRIIVIFRMNEPRTQIEYCGTGFAISVCAFRSLIMPFLAGAFRISNTRASMIEVFAFNDCGMERKQIN